MLILETDDIALTNSEVAPEALECASEARDDFPHEIYFVETTSDSQVAVFPLNPAAVALFRRNPGREKAVSSTVGFVGVGRPDELN